MNQKVYEYDTKIVCTPENGGAYVVFPWNVRDEFGKGRVKVSARFDGELYEGSIETMARNIDSCINTNFGYDKLKNILESNNIPVRISNNAGTSFCNILYWNGLNYIYNQCLDTKMIFLHIPFSKNIADCELFFKRILTVIDKIYSREVSSQGIRNAL